MQPPSSPNSSDTGGTAARARFVRDRFPKGGLFAGHEWRLSPEPFELDPRTAAELESLGRVLLQFNRAANLLYRHSIEGKQPQWIAEWLNRGKPPELLELQNSPAFKNEIPRVIRPDILLTDGGMRITELDSIPGGIGVTAWLNETYSQAATQFDAGESAAKIIGGARGMLDGFAGIFTPTSTTAGVHLVISDEAATYRPEMEWIAARLGPGFQVRDAQFNGFAAGDAIYRFFELFDLPNIPCAHPLFNAAHRGEIQMTPPPKAFLEEKMQLALLWNRNLEGFWRRELGAAFFARLKELVPYTWMIDPTPLPPHGAVPRLEITGWNQLKSLSKRERSLVLKVSGFSEDAWGARGVYLGSDLSTEEWSAAVDLALDCHQRSPFILQEYHKPSSIPARWFDFQSQTAVPMHGRVRLCPYYFVHGNADDARPHLGGVLATICPADKKIIHGMKEAILAPCAISNA